MKKILKNESKNVILWVDIQTSTLSSNASLWDVGMLTVLFSFLSPIFIFSMDILVDSLYKNLLWNIPLEYWHKNLIFWTKISDDALSTLLTLKKLWRPFLEVLWVERQVASRWLPPVALDKKRQMPSKNEIRLTKKAMRPWSWWI